MGREDLVIDGHDVTILNTQNMSNYDVASRTLAKYLVGKDGREIETVCIYALPGEAGENISVTGKKDTVRVVADV